VPVVGIGYWKRAKAVALVAQERVMAKHAAGARLGNGRRRAVGQSAGGKVQKTLYRPI